MEKTSFLPNHGLAGSGIFFIDLKGKHIIFSIVYMLPKHIRVIIEVQVVE